MFSNVTLCLSKLQIALKAFAVDLMMLKSFFFSIVNGKLRDWGTERVQSALINCWATLLLSPARSTLQLNTY